jgi:hypothetical protein
MASSRSRSIRCSDLSGPESATVELSQRFCAAKRTSGTFHSGRVESNNYAPPPIFSHIYYENSLFSTLHLLNHSFALGRLSDLELLVLPRLPVCRYGRYLLVSTQGPKPIEPRGSNMPSLDESAAENTQSLTDDIPFPIVTRENILHCSYDYWFPKYGHYKICSVGSSLTDMVTPDTGRRASAHALFRFRLALSTT